MIFFHVGVPATSLSLIRASHKSQDKGDIGNESFIVTGTPIFLKCFKKRISSHVCCSLKLVVGKNLEDIK